MELFNIDTLNETGNTLLQKNQTIAVSESVTAGLLQFAFSNVPNASNFFQGGLTAYNIAQKFKHLNVEPIHALAINCVSEKVAVEMALQVSESFNSNWGIGITGYSTPVPESANQLFAFFAIVHNKAVRQAGKLAPVATDPVTVQLEYVNKVIAILNKLVHVS